MKNVNKIILSLSLCLGLFFAKPAKADFWGGDIPLLIKIVANTLEQLIVLKQIFKTGQDHLGLTKELNKGIRDGLQVIRVLNPKFNPGLYGNLETVQQVQRAIEDLYGLIPQTNQSKLQAAQDRTVSESIVMNGRLFQYADDVDAETKRIIEHAQNVSPQGAAKLTAESLAILIGVTTQILRTNSMMLKVMGQNMALANRREKLESEQFKTQYEGLSSALGSLPSNPKLKPLK